MTASLPTSIADAIKQRELDAASALRWAQSGNIEAWTHHYLRSGTGGSTNVAFSDSLKRAPRWWNGPLYVPLDALVAAVGVEPEKEYVVAPDDWHRWTSRLAATFTDPLALPPLIVEYRSGALSVRDGNTRLGAMRLLGWPSCWVVIWYNSRADFEQHNAVLL